MFLNLNAVGKIVDIGHYISSLCVYMTAAFDVMVGLIILSGDTSENHCRPLIVLYM